MPIYLLIPKKHKGACKGFYSQNPCGTSDYEAVRFPVRTCKLITTAIGRLSISIAVFLNK